MQDDALVVVFNSESAAEALLYRTMLEEAGIDVIERPMDGFEQRGLHSQLQVRAEDAESARELVDAFTQEAEDGELTLPDDAPPDDTPPA